MVWVGVGQLVLELEVVVIVADEGDKEMDMTVLGLVVCRWMRKLG